MRTITLNEDDMGCEHGLDNRVTCGTCQRNWCDTCNPTPSARCLYEYEHTDDEAIYHDAVIRDANDDDSEAPLAPHGGCNWRGCLECFPDEKVRKRMEQEEIQRAINFLEDAGFTVTKDECDG